jgi:hypothetical protein
MEKRSVSTSSHVQISNNSHKDTRTLSSAAMHLFRGLTLSSSTWQTTSDEGMEMTCYSSDGRGHGSDVHVRVSRTELSPTVTMQDDERCILWNGRITGVEEKNEIPKPRNAYTPMVMSVFNSVIDAEKNIQKITMGRRPKIDDVDPATASKIVIKEAIFGPARASAKNRSDSSDRVRGTSNSDGSTSFLPEVCNNTLVRKDTLASRATTGDISPSDAMKSISTTNLQDQNNVEVSFSKSKSGWKQDVKAQPITKSLLESRYPAHDHKPALG